MRQVQGPLWRRPDGDRPVAGERKIGRRVDEDGSAWAIVHVVDAPSGLEPVTPTLEEACSTFLARHGEAALEDAAQEEAA